MSKFLRVVQLVILEYGPIAPTTHSARLGLRARNREKGGSNVRTFCRDPAAHEWKRELGSGPYEAKITGKLQAGYAHAGSMPVHSSDGNFPTAEDGERYLTPEVPVGWGRAVRKETFPERRQRKSSTHYVDPAVRLLRNR